MLQQIISLIITGVLTVHVTFCGYKSGKVKACVMGAGFFAVAFLLDGIFGFIMAGFEVGSDNISMQIMGILVSKCILVAGLIFLKVVGSDGWTKEQTASWQYTDVLTVITSVFVVALAAFICYIENMKVYHRIMFLLVFIVFFAGYLISVYMHEKREHERRIQTEEAGKKHAADNYLESVENNYQRTRELWHDLKNHINLMQVLLYEEKYDELNDYLRIFSEDVDTLTLPMKSGNVVVDALLSDKLGRAKREGVELRLSLCNLTGLNLQSDEICGLFGNLMDNAIEANRSVMEGKLIEVECTEQETCYYIRVRNKAADSVAAAADSEHALNTAKSDRRNQVGHGLGLRSVERIVHGCGGELVVEVKGNMFIVVVRLSK